MTPVPTRSDNTARLKYIVKTTILHLHETRQVVKDRKPQELDWSPDSGCRRVRPVEKVVRGLIAAPGHSSSVPSRLRCGKTTMSKVTDNYPLSEKRPRPADHSHGRVVEGYRPAVGPGRQPAHERSANRSRNPGASGPNRRKRRQAPTGGKT